MRAPLEQQVVIRSHACETRDRGVYGLKVDKEQRIGEVGECRLESVNVVPRCPRLHARSRTPLSLSQFEVIGYVVDGLDAHFLQFPFRTRVESRQIPNVVIRKRRIAAVEELADNGIVALTTRCNVRGLRHGKDGKLRT